MTTEIPTYEIGAVDGTDMLVQHPNTMFTTGFSEGMNIEDGARFYLKPIMVGNPSILYGPGSGTFEIVKCEIVTTGDTETTEAIPIDPKTYIDNYGYVHIGPTNYLTADHNPLTQSIRITFKSTYHYINPSTGDLIAESGETYFTVLKNNEAVNDEIFRSIPYSALSGNVAAD